MNIELTFTPHSHDIEFLTTKINEESKALGITEQAHRFAFFMRDDKQEIIAGCDGSIIYGSIYTDQLWVHPDYRKRGYGRMLMEKVHEFGCDKECTIAIAATMSFQETRGFYEHLGYSCDFERPGYTKGSTCIFLKKVL